MDTLAPVLSSLDLTLQEALKKWKGNSNFCKIKMTCNWHCVNDLQTCDGAKFVVPGRHYISRINISDKFYHKFFALLEQI